MARVIGQIESLRRIREALDREGITQFNCIGDLRNFERNYESLKEEVLFKEEQNFDLEVEDLQTRAKHLQIDYETTRQQIINSQTERINSLENKCASLQSKKASNAFKEMAYWYQLLYYQLISYISKKSFDGVVRSRTANTKKVYQTATGILNSKLTKRQLIISKRCAPKFNKLDHAKETIDSLYSLIAGAIGEYRVKEELEKLSDKFTLFNDFSLKFDPPLYNRKEDDHIYSVQIDHLLVTNAGVFIIETKNWSKKSIKRYDLRSPIDQVQRASYALFVLLNSQEFVERGILETHHWGSKKIPIKSIVAMINHKPKGEFNYVKILKLNELKSYIEYFKPIFNNSEVERIVNRLILIKD